MYFVEDFPPLHPDAALLPESDLDGDWMCEFFDFQHFELNLSLGEGSDMEDPMAELGLYDPTEDLSSRSFEEVYNDNQWQEAQLTLNNGPRRFTGPLPGALHPRNGSSESAVHYFKRFWPTDVLNRICEETNRYAGQTCQQFPRLTNGRRDWCPLTVDELLCWFGVLVFMGLKDLPNICLYWSPNDFYGCPLIKSCMTRTRFEAITGDVRTEATLVGADAVLQAVRGLEGRGHVIITDNFFSGVSLFMTLLDRGFYATGTARKGSRGFPSALAGFPKQHHPKRGTLVVKMHRSRLIVAVMWLDSKPMWLLSTALNPIDPTCVAPRWVKRDRVDFPTSPILLQYQGNMRGVDAVDQYMQYYTAALQSHK